MPIPTRCLGLSASIAVVLAAGVCASQEPDAHHEPEPAAAQACDPPCRGMFTCVDGACVSPCASPCPKGFECTATGQCVQQPGAAEPAPQTGWGTPQPQRSPEEEWAITSALLEEELEEEEAEREPTNFALLINPASFATTLPMYGFVGIPINVQIAGSYIGLDLLVTPIFGEINGFAGEIGMRILPFGEGLRSLYIVPRVGGGYPMGSRLSGVHGLLDIVIGVFPTGSVPSSGSVSVDKGHADRGRLYARCSAAEYFVTDVLRD